MTKAEKIARAALGEAYDYSWTPSLDGAAGRMNISFSGGVTFDMLAALSRGLETTRINLSANGDYYGGVDRDVQIDGIPAHLFEEAP